MDLDAYRTSAEQFVSALTAAFYRHYAGLTDEYELEPIYARHAELFERPAVEALREQLDQAPPDSEERRRLRMLLAFALEGFIGNATKRAEEEVARREAEATIEVGGDRIGFRASAVAQANEPDPDRREAIERARLAVIATLNALYQELVEGQHHCAAELGYASYRELCETATGVDLARLAAQTAAFSAASRERYPSVLEPELQRVVGRGLGELRRSDLPRFFRAADDDRLFPAEQLIPSLRATQAGLAIPAQRPNVIVDVEPRPRKSPRAFCAPVRVPDEVYLVIAPIGGRDDFAALFHEAGHTEHYAHVAPDLPFEFRQLGDNAITECFAFLMQHLTENRRWLERRLSVAEPDQLLAYSRAHRLVYLRRYAAKLAYELELHTTDGPLAALADRYAALLGEALEIRGWPRETYLADVDPGFYSACYLRAWALETHLRAHLTERFGEAWFEQAQAGELLRTLWREGQRRTPEELLGELTGEELDFRVLLTDLGLD